MQKVKKLKDIIPFRTEREGIEVSGDEMAAEDYDTMHQLVKSGDKQALKDFINKRLATNEDRLREEAPGLSTRDYMSALTGEAVRRRYPDINKASLEGSPAELGKVVRKNMFPKIEEALKAHNLSSVIRDAKGEEGDEVDMGDRAGETTLKGELSPSGNVGTAIHENAHLLDLLAQRRSQRMLEGNEDSDSMHEFLKSKPAAKRHFTEKGLEPIADKTFTRSELMNKEHGRIVNKPVPDFSSYDFATGDFGSEYIEDPVDIQDEAGKAHHIDRNQTYENMIKALEDDGKLDRLTQREKFKKLRQRLG